jgi:hypothetical protein
LSLMVIIIERDGDVAGVNAQLDVIDALRSITTPMRALVYDTPWVQVRWANPRYL